MANRSFEFKIGADTSDFIKGMNNADKAVDKFEKQAQKLEKGLKINFDEGRFTQSQKLMQQALEQTEKNADACRRELKYLEEAGQMDTSAYEQIQNQLAQAENKAVLLKKKLQELNALRFTTLGNNIKKAGQALTSLASSMKAISIASTAVVAGLVKVAKQTISTGDEIATLASKYGVSATQIQKWQYIAMQSDVEETSLYKGLQKLNSAIADLAKGEVNNATKALTDLGLGADTSFETLIARLSSLTDETDKLYYANQIFGDKLGADIIPLLNQGSEAVAEYIKEFEEVGYLSEDEVSKLSELDNMLNKLQAMFKELALELGMSLMPLVEQIVDYIQANVVPKIQLLIDKFNSLSQEQKRLAAKILILIPIVTALTAGIGKAIIGVGNLIIALPKLATLLSTLAAHPVIAIIGVVAALLTLLYTKNEKFRESVSRLISILSKALAPIVEMIGDQLSNILQILDPIIQLMGDRLAKRIELICDVLEPLVEILSWIMEAIQWINDGMLTLLGKGWLWGTDSQEKSKSTGSRATASTYSAPQVEYPTITNPTYTTSSTESYVEDNSTTVNNITIEANEYTSAEEVARVLSLKLQSRR